MTAPCGPRNRKIARAACMTRMLAIQTAAAISTAVQTDHAATPELRPRTFPISRGVAPSITNPRRSKSIETV